MKNVIVYQKNSAAQHEISEYFRNKGYSPVFADSSAELISLLGKSLKIRLFLYIQNLSDIRLLQTIRSLYADADISLIIPPNLQDIIDLLRNNNFKIINDVTQVQ